MLTKMVSKGDKKMLLTQELQEKLKSLCDGKSKIVIEGFNGYGDMFTTKGRISKGDDATPVVYENVVFIDFGHREGRPYSEFVAGFVTECMEGKVYGDDLIVARISLESGEVLFENADAGNYMAQAQKNMEKHEAEARAEGRWIEERDPVSEKLMELVGRPFRIGNHQGVVVNPPRTATNSGAAIVDYRTVGRTCVFVDEKACLEVLDLDTDQFEFVVSNGLVRPDGQPVSDIDEAFQTKMMTERLIYQRAQSIESASKKQPGAN